MPGRPDRLARLRAVSQAVAQRRYLLRIKDVIGTSVGFRERAGQQTDEPVITVFVRKGRKDQDPAGLPRHQRIPRQLQIQIDGETVSIPVDIVERDIGRLTNGPPAIAVGMSIGNALAPDTAGTVGWIARRDEESGEPVVCSAFHVLLRFGASKITGNVDKKYECTYPDYEEVTVPAIRDAHGVEAMKIGYVLAGRRNNFVDVAMVRLDAPGLLSPIVRGLGALGSPRSIEAGDLDPNRPVIVSMSTRDGTVLTGKISRCQVNYVFTYADLKRGLMMMDLIETTIASRDGDLGGLLIDAQRRPLGMLIGGTGGCSYFCHIQNICQALQLRAF